MEPVENIVKTILFVPRSLENYRYYTNTNFQQPRSIRRDKVYGFILRYLRPECMAQAMDWISARKIFLLDADAGTLVELLCDYDANVQTLMTAVQGSKLSDALADKKEREASLANRQKIPFEDQFENLIGSKYNKILGAREEEGMNGRLKRF